MDEQLENRLRFLREANTEGMPHSDRGLFDHLLGTRQLLVEWEARPALCDAGLFHSVYGTEHYELKAVPLTMRKEVQQLIGVNARLQPRRPAPKRERRKPRLETILGCHF